MMLTVNRLGLGWDLLQAGDDALGRKILQPMGSVTIASKVKPL